MKKFSEYPIQGKIIYVTIVVYALTQLWRLGCTLFCVMGYDWRDMLALPADLNRFLWHPWTLVTYMFCHANIGHNVLHIVFNMLWLWWFSPFFLRYHTGRQLLSLYLTAGIASGLFFLAVYNAFPYFLIDRHFVRLAGASGAIMALITATAVRQPDERIGFNFFIRTAWIKFKWVAAFVFALTLLNLGSDNNGGEICHLGGALFGLCYGMAERKGHDLTAWMGRVGDGLVGLWQRLTSLFRPRPRMKATAGGRHDPISREKMRDMDYNAERRARQERIDAILDKISKHGYDGLTAEEKQTLFDASARARKQR